MEKHISSNKRMSFGIFLIALGAFWILEKLGLIPDVLDDILISLPMLLIGIGVFSLIGGKKKFGIVLIVIGSSYIIIDNVPILNELKQLGWPLIIISLGVVLLITHGRKKPDEPLNAEQSSHGIDYFDDLVIFGGREVFVNSQNFYGGKITSMFGGAEYDLRQAGLSENGAVVDCVSVFGACEFKVPPDWTVKNEVTAIFGAFSDKRGNSFNQTISNPSKTLIVKGFSAFGAIEIKY